MLNVRQLDVPQPDGLPSLTSLGAPIWGGNVVIAGLVAFIDPTRKVAEDSRKNYGETRYNMLAKVDGRIFHVIFTERGKIVWIISARKANKREQRRYEQG